MIHTNTFASVRAGVVPGAAGDDLLLAAVGAHCVDAVTACAAGLTQAAALIDVWTRKETSVRKRFQNTEKQKRNERKS